MAPVKLITLVRTDGPAPLAARLSAAARGLPGLHRLLFNHVLPVEVRNPAGAAPERWDAVVESWLDHRDRALQWVDIIGTDQLAVHLLVDQRMIHDSGLRPLPAKVMVTFRRRPDLTRAQAQAHWAGEHVRVGLVEHSATDFLRLYLQNHVVEVVRADNTAHAYDGLPEYWLDQGSLNRVGENSEVMRAIAADEANFIDRASISTLLLQEELLYAAPGAASGWDEVPPATPDHTETG